MNEIGNRILIGNSEDMMSLVIAEVTDIYEVSETEVYNEILIYSVCPTIKNKI